MSFEAFPKIGRISRECVVTEKIDGTNAQVYLLSKTQATPETTPDGKYLLGTVDDLLVYAGSRNRFITPEDDNFGFAKFVVTNINELAKMGHGRHYGEWWGLGIGPRQYGLNERRFSLFNTARWGAHNPNTPACVSVVPVVGKYTLDTVEDAMVLLKEKGSLAAPGFMNPEGIIIYADRNFYKKTFDHDQGKWTAVAA